jgi:Family of unknown function (DUF6527)
MVQQFSHQFVDKIPSTLEENVLYVSMVYAVAVHRCPSGCGKDVVTPLGFTGWRLEFDGAVTLRPSIGNWSYPCRSHYWIICDRIVWGGTYAPVAELWWRHPTRRATASALTRWWRRLRGFVSIGSGRH